MFSTYTAKYTKIKSGYMGQLVEWPEVVTEGKTLEECRAMLQDALKEMILAYRQQKKEIPPAAPSWNRSQPRSRCLLNAGILFVNSKRAAFFFFVKARVTPSIRTIRRRFLLRGTSRWTG